MSSNFQHSVEILISMTTVEFWITIKLNFTIFHARILTFYSLVFFSFQIFHGDLINPLWILYGCLHHLPLNPNNHIWFFFTFCGNFDFFSSGFFWIISHHVRWYLRGTIPKFRLEVCKMKKSKFPKLCQNIGLDELYLEKVLLVWLDFYFSRTATKSVWRL